MSGSLSGRPDISGYAGRLRGWCGRGWRRWSLRLNRLLIGLIRLPTLAVLTRATLLTTVVHPHSRSTVTALPAWSAVAAIVEVMA